MAFYKIFLFFQSSQSHFQETHLNDETFEDNLFGDLTDGDDDVNMNGIDDIFSNPEWGDRKLIFFFIFFLLLD